MIREKRVSGTTGGEERREREREREKEREGDGSKATTFSVTDF